MPKNIVEINHLLDDLMNAIKKEGINKLNADNALPIEPESLSEPGKTLLTDRKPPQSITKG